MRTETLGKILGAVGLLALLSSPYTYFITTGSVLLAACKAVVGVILVGTFFATNYKKLGQFASKKSSFFVLSSALWVLGVLVALIALNTIAAKRSKTWDLTSKKIFTLAPQTLEALKGLKGPVHVTAFLAPTSAGYEATEQLLSRYHREAPEHFQYGFKDPRKAPDLAQKYQLREGQETLILSKGEGMAETHAAINLSQTQTLSEQDLTNALVKLASEGVRTVYFVAGHGELPLAGGGDEGPGLSDLSKALTQEGYEPKVLNLAGKTELPKDASAVVLAGARAKLTSKEEQLLDTYLAQGGKLLVFAEAEQEFGLKATLAKYGVELDKGVVADDHFAIDNPYQLVTSFFSEHELGKSLKRLQLNIQLPVARGLTVLKEGTLPGVKVEPVLLTSEYAWEEPTLSNDPKPAQGTKTGSIALVVASTHPTADAKDKRTDEARLVVFGDADLLADSNFGYEPNRNLVLNALGWATNQLGKITLRPPDRDISTLDIDAGLMGRIRFVATDLLPLSLLGLGLAIWLGRRDQ